jgi:nitrogen fixation/metabolism regulation signal transduction histidine kinase
MRPRLQIWLAILAGVFLFGTVSIFAVFALAPNTAALNRPILLTGFVVALFLSLVCLVSLLRWLLRPYSQLVGEAKRAPVAHSGRTQNEAEFVLETFQSVLAQLQEQRNELERLSAEASQRADSAEKFSERIVASMPTGLIAFDASGRATVINGPARALLETEVVGDHFHTLLHNVPSLAELVEHCLATGKVFRREEIETADGLGRSKRLGATVAPIDPASGAGKRGALCLLTDITEVMQLREQVALKRNLESLGEMSAGLAHEFKNAIATLHGYAQFLQTIGTDERGQAAASALLVEVRNLSEMITSFLNFARPQPLQLEQVSLVELIGDCATELQSLFDDRRVELIINGFFSAQPQRGSSPTVREGSGSPEGIQAEVSQSIEIQADARMLRQALSNLMRNAAEAISDAKTDRRVVVVSAIEQDQTGKQWAVITIQDTGDGIRTADLQKIFIPFFTTKSKGHGVGLALAHRVITEHGGTLTATNAPAGGGALFTIRLPFLTIN